MFSFEWTWRSFRNNRRISQKVSQVCSCFSQWPLACWDCGFESHRGPGCLSVVECCQKSLRRTDHSPRGVLPTVVRHWVWSRNLVNEEEIIYIYIYIYIYYFLLCFPTQTLHLFTDFFFFPSARVVFGLSVNPLKPNDPYMGRTAPLTSICWILYIYSTNRLTKYFKHAAYSPVFFFKMSFIS